MKTSKDMNNREIARLLREIAAAYEVKASDPPSGSPRGEAGEASRFRIRAYEDAADSIEKSSSEVKDLWEEGKLKDIPGIGESLSSHLDELFRTGTVKHFEHAKKGIPQGMFPLLKISGIGPKTAFSLAKHLNLNIEKNAIERLQEAIKEGKIATIEGFGEDSQTKLSEAIGQWGRREDRMLLPEATELANKVKTYLHGIPGVLRIEMLGSLRRRAPTAGDVDLAVATTKPDTVLKKFVKFAEWKEILASGTNTARAIHRSGRHVDIKTEPPGSFGSLLQHFTGSKEHNVHLREVALTKRFSLSEHGIKSLKGSTLSTQGRTLKRFKTEEEFYGALGMQWIPPELREDRGEIEAALRSAQDKPGGLPHLVELPDIKGDFHIHSNIDIETSHDLGVSSLSEIVEKAERLGYGYIAISDHNPSTSKHKQREIIDLIKRRNDKIDTFIRSRGTNMKIHIFKSLEIDILPDGRRAIPDEAMELLDFATVSVHSNFMNSKENQTQRVLNALNHPKVKIFGHPTGRKLLEREGIDYDWDRIFEFCKTNGICPEINANPVRLDLPDSVIKEAIKAGITLAIGTDAHEVSNMGFMRYGVDMARRGWAEKKDIINTVGYNELIKRLAG